jgi:hypothetical protein
VLHPYFSPQLAPSTSRTAPQQGENESINQTNHIVSGLILTNQRQDKGTSTCTTCSMTAMNATVGAAANDDGFSKDPELVLESFLHTPIAEGGATANLTSTDEPATGIHFPPTLVDDDLTMDIDFLSMHQLLNDPATISTTAEGSTSASAGLEPSIVSGTTDLFEGDLGDDGKFGL